MREWNLGAGDPLFLNISADARLSRPNYSSDPTWELSQEGEDPPALTLQTTFGLRASWLRLFPRFSRAGKDVTDPSTFAGGPRLSRFYPNLLSVTLAPFPGIDARLDYWVPDSETLAGRIRITNESVLPETLTLELAGILSPLGDGESLSPAQIGPGSVLKGCTDRLWVAIALNGAPKPVSSPYPALALTLELAPGNSREVTWALAALPDLEAAVELARRAAALPWESQVARIEMQHLHHHVDIQTGNPDWDAAFAFTQQAAYRLFFPGSAALPFPSFVLSRGIEQGYSPRGNGSDYSYGWNGQTVLDSWYLAGLILPGAPELVEGLVQNFLAVQDAAGEIDWKPGLAGQRGRHLAQPLLAALALRVDQHKQDPGWLTMAFPRLLAFLRAWFSPSRDRDGDGLPEWDHPLQTGFEGNPLYDRWQPGAQGADIQMIESPALGAFLYNECRCLIRLAKRAGREEDVPWLEEQAARLHRQVEACWDEAAGIYRFRDFETHLSAPGQTVATLHGPGTVKIRAVFDGPRRMVLRIESADENTRAGVITIHGETPTGAASETIQPNQIFWTQGHGRATTRQTFLAVEQIEVRGLQPGDWLQAGTIDFTQEALSLLLPLWAGIPNPKRSARILDETLPRFRGVTGYSLGPRAGWEDHPGLERVSLVWNQFVGETLLAQGRRDQAAALVSDLMDAVVSALKRDRAFRQFYHADSGRPQGEINSLVGLAPLGLFLRTAGIDRLTPDEIILSANNPFPWPITVQYRGVTILRGTEETLVTYPDGQTIPVSGPGPYRLSRS